MTTGHYRTAKDIGGEHNVSSFVVARAAKQAKIPTQLCRKRWRLLYLDCQELIDAIYAYKPIEYQTINDIQQAKTNGALDSILSALRRQKK